MSSPVGAPMLLGMTTMSETSELPEHPPTGGPPPFGGWNPPPYPPPGPQPGWGGSARPVMLRRSREDRVAVGLAGGLGRYFGVDPVIFRVIFGVLALFGGSGIVLYLLGWAAIPDEGTADAPVDRAIATLRRRHVPVSAVLIVGLIVVWAAFFSWWAPSSFIPALALVAVVALLVTRGGRVRPAGFDPAGSPWPPVPGMQAGPGSNAPTAGMSASGSELRSWLQESRSRAQVRRQRRRPIERVVLLAAIAVLGVLTVRDVTHGVALNDYFFAIGGIVFVGLLIGAALKRTPWPLLPLLIPAAVGVFVFGSSGASAHDGVGDRNWTPATSGGLNTDYRMAFGRGTLDLTGTSTPATGRSTNIRMGAGQLRVIVPKDLAVAVISDIHSGELEVDAVKSNSGLNFADTYLSPTALADPSVPRITVYIKLASGEVSIDNSH